ncbi:hypothetical protein J4207_02055 [Candidatus Woesearchaeota archaeon]|nr:hypothetical protein [Candidatus Woesearchaeota archaeon]
MATYSMSQWMTAMKEQGIGHSERLQEAIENDLTKWERLKKLNGIIGLPIDKHTHFSAADVLHYSQNAKNFFSHYKNARFSIKAEPLEDFKEQLPRHRQHGITQQQCVEFVRLLNPAPENYAISIWEYFDSTLSGTIIVGKEQIIVEAVEGSHSILTQGFQGNVVQAWHDFHHLQISDERLRPVVQQAVDALRCNDSCVSITNGFVQGYFEFLHCEKGFRFIDYNATPMMSTLDVKHVDGILKGTMASQGSCKGRVCVVRDETDFLKVKTGDVLVTPMTDPRFVPLLKKVVGIITDFGGVTCHAAIIARELGIPCVVGTGSATKVLKDGDVVEMKEGNMILR